MADLTRMAEAAQRTANALLRAAGGRAVTLRVPIPVNQGGAAATEADELGLGLPAFADVELAPTVFRQARPETARTTGVMRWELLISATAVERAAGTRDMGACFAMFAGAAGVVVNGTLLTIAGMSSSDVAGSPYLYRMQLQSTVTRLP